MSRCGKRRYPDKLAALIALSNIQRRDNRAAGYIEKRAYHCKTCSGWHLTSQPRRLHPVD